MSVRNLEHLLQPKSVAVVGASNTPMRVGSIVMRNLLRGGFEGAIMPVNPKHQSIGGVLAYPSIAALPINPDLAVVCTPSHAVPGLITQLGERGCRAAIVLTAGLSTATNDQGKRLDHAMLEAARPFSLRILGPNCLGSMTPGIGLNATFSHLPVEPGHLAFVSQSGALGAGLLDWARYVGIGFSHFVSLGDCADIDFGDMLDYLGSDPAVRGILLYIESIKEPRKFMSAARAAARNKKVIAIKAGRVAEGARAAASHTGALAGSDDVFDTALRRAGILRVYETGEIFDAAETLAHVQRISGDRLAILTNGGGLGVLATDALISSGGRLAELSPATIQRLDAVLPPTWSRANPVDIIGDADADRYRSALSILLEDENIDAVLIMNIPTALAASEDTPRCLIDVAKQTPRTILTNWLGGETAVRARRLFAEAGIPSYATPCEAVRAFMHMVHYQRNQNMLMEIPPSIPTDFVPDHAGARTVIEQVLAQGRDMLTEPEAKSVLAAYGIPTVETHTARDADEAMRVAERIGFPVVLKILSPDVSHKSDIGGVVLNLESAYAVRGAAEVMHTKFMAAYPEGRFDGYAVQKMVRRPDAIELIVGTLTDPIFGPVILFGRGGKAVELIRDRAVTLPPLNMALAAEVVSRTRVWRRLKGYRDQPSVDLDALYGTLVRISQLLVDRPEVLEMDINPLLSDSEGVLALDARIRVAASKQSGVERLAIRPYPAELAEEVVLESGQTILLRPIRPEDEPAHLDFVHRLSEADVYSRFFGLVKEWPHSEMARFTQIDYDREMAFIAVGPDDTGKESTLGVVRAVRDADNESGEFAIVVRSDIKGMGLGHVLLDKLLRYCRDTKLHYLKGEVLAENHAMRKLARDFGFVECSERMDEIVEVTLDLSREPAALCS